MASAEITNVWGKLIYGGIAAIFLYAIFHLIYQRNEPTMVTAGWDHLSPCSYVSSFDGKQHLALSENHFARMEEEADQHNIDGSWSFDAVTNLYTITVRNESTIYSTVSPGDGNTCMLIKGDLGAADLRRSWFYSPADLDDQTDSEPRDR